MLLTWYFTLKLFVSFLGKITSFRDLECHKQCFDGSCSFSNVTSSSINRNTRCLHTMKIIATFYLLCDYFCVIILIKMA